MPDFSFSTVIICLFIFTNSVAQTDWKLHKNSNDIQLWTRKLEDSSLKEFKLKTKIKLEIKTMFRFIRDVEKMSLWYEKVKSVKLLKKLNENEAIYLLEYDLPFPFEDRISTIKGTISFDEKIGTIKVSTEYFPFPIPPGKYKLQLITKISSYWEIIDLHNGLLDITHAGYMDPGGNIPVWLVNEGVDADPIKTVNGMKQALKKFY